MNTSNKSQTKTYLVTFAALLAVPFALQAGGYTDDQPRTEETTTRVGSNGETLAPDTAPLRDNQVDRTRTTAVRTDADAGTRSADMTTRVGSNNGDNIIADDTMHVGHMDHDMSRDHITTGPEVDGPSRSSNGIARVPNELRAQALDTASNPVDAEATDNDGRVIIGHARLASTEQNVGSTAYSQDRKARVDLTKDNAIEMQLNTEATAQNIESTEFRSRDLAITMAESGVAEGKQIVSAIRANGTPADAEARKDLDKAMHKVEKAEQKLNSAILSSRQSSESRWDDVRDQLADRYEDYSEALENAREVALDGGMRFETQVSMIDSNLPEDRS